MKNNYCKEISDVYHMFRKVASFKIAYKPLIRGLETYNVLKYLVEHKDEEISQNDISKELEYRKQLVAELIDELESYNYLVKTKSKIDKRKNIIMPTVLASQELLRQDKIFDEINNEISIKIDKDKQESFFEAMEIIKNALSDIINKC